MRQLVVAKSSVHASVGGRKLFNKQQNQTLFFFLFFLPVPEHGLHQLLQQLALDLCDVRLGLSIDVQHHGDARRVELDLFENNQ